MMKPCNGKSGMVRKCLEIFEECPQIWWSNRYGAKAKTCLKVKLRCWLEWLDAWAMEHDERISTKNRLSWGKIIALLRRFQHAVLVGWPDDSHCNTLNKTFLLHERMNSLLERTLLKYLSTRVQFSSSSMLGHGKMSTSVHWNWKMSECINT